MEFKDKQFFEEQIFSSVNDSALGFHSWQKFFLGLTKKKYDGMSVAARSLCLRADMANADIFTRLAYLRTGRPFETPFDGTRMDVVAKSDRKSLYDFVANSEAVFVRPISATNGDFSVYSIRYDPFTKLPVFDSPGVTVRMTEPGKGMICNLEGLVCWADYLARQTI